MYSLNLKLSKARLVGVKIEINNTSTDFSEYLVENNVGFADLNYYVTVKRVESYKKAYKNKRIQSYVPLKRVKKLSLPYKPQCLLVHECLQDFVYEVSASLFDSKNGVNVVSSSPQHFCYSHKISEYFDKYGQFKPLKAKILSNSEKAVASALQQETAFYGLNSLLPREKIKSYVFQARDTKNIDEFKKSSYKYANPDKEESFKKALFTKSAKLFFDETQGPSHLFLKNEWSQGPLYSYNLNYQPYLKAI